MNDLIRRALLGDREAQEECTKQGIVLPCPFCGGEAELKQLSGRWAVCCKTHCVGTKIYGNKAKALTAWNTRQGPPIGRCETCSYWIKTTCYCWKSKIFGQSCRKDEYCSSWTSKEEAENG